MAYTGGQVGRHRLVDAFRTRQVQAIHDCDEFSLGLTGQSLVVLLFESNGCVRTPLVIVTGPDRGLVGQGKQMLLDALIQRLRTARLEVGPATPIDEERVAGEDVIAFEASCHARMQTLG